MLKRPHYIVAGLVVVIALILLNLPSHAATRLKLAIGSLFLPLFGLAGSSQQLAEKAGDALLSRSELLRENETLRRENQQLRIQAHQAEETARENNRLRQLFHWQEQTPWKSRLKLARVVLHEPANWWRGVGIDLGSRDGVRANLPVLTAEGVLVGKIETVSLTRSQVVLIGDQNCKVPARVENDAEGIIGGANGPFDSSLVPMDYIPANATVKSGQNVLTSGKGEIFPAGILIGNVVDAHPVEYGLYLEARVKPAANLSALKEVWVLLP